MKKHLPVIVYGLFIALFVALVGLSLYYEFRRFMFFMTH